MVSEPPVRLMDHPGYHGGRDIRELHRKPLRHAGYSGTLGIRRHHANPARGDPRGQSRIGWLPARGRTTQRRDTEQPSDDMLELLLEAPDDTGDRLRRSEQQCSVLGLVDEGTVGRLDDAALMEQRPHPRAVSPCRDRSADESPDRPEPGDQSADRSRRELTTRTDCAGCRTRARYPVITSALSVPPGTGGACL